MLRWSRKRKGFTLVELVIVIAILGILAMYALPKYQGIIKEARSSEARAQLGSFRSALGIYYAKHHGVYPDYNTVKAATNNILFADGTVPEVEISLSDGTVNKSRGVKAASDTTDGVVTSSEVSSDTDTDVGGWVYDDGSDMTPAYSKADVRINSKDRDPADSNTDKLDWYQY